MASALRSAHGINPIELAILAKWLLHETWLCSMQVLEQRRSTGLMSHERNTKLQEMHTGFFYQAFYRPVYTIADVNRLLQNLRKMLLMLKELDVIAWSRFMMENELS
jgi:hypothetical protein